MYSIKLNINDSILDKVMMKNLVTFLKSPLKDITIERKHEIYNQRVEF